MVDYIVEASRGEKPNREWETVSNMAANLQKMYPELHLSIQQWGERILHDNPRIKDKDGHDCKGHLDVAIIRPGWHLKLYGNKPVPHTFAHERDCNNNETEILLLTTPEGSNTVVNNSVDQTVGVKLADYPNGGSTALNTPEIATWQYIPQYLGIMPPMPVPAARGRNRNSTGSQTTAGTLVNVVEELAIKALPSAAMVTRFSLIPLALDVDVNNSLDRVIPSREGNGEAKFNRDGKPYKYPEGKVAGRSGRISMWPFNGHPFSPLSPNYRDISDAFAVPISGVDVDAHMNVIDDPNSPFGFGRVGYIPRGGSYAPSMIQSERKQNTGKDNTHMRGHGGRPVTLDGSTNYGQAEFAAEVSLSTQISAAMESYAKHPNAADAKRVVELYNYSITLVGKGEFDIRADVSKPLSPELFSRLTNSEQIAYMRNRFIEATTKDGFPVAQDTMPLDTPVKTIPRDQFIANQIKWYTQFATEQPGPFRTQYRFEMREKAEYDPKDPKSVEAIVTAFVNHSPMVQHYQGDVSLNQFDKYMSTRRADAPQDLHQNNLNPYERGEYRPKVKATDGSIIARTHDMLSQNPEIVSYIMALSNDGDVGQAWGSFDDKSIQLPKTMFPGDRKHWDRRQLLAERAQRYNPAHQNIFGTTLSREETKGHLLDLPGIQQNMIQTAGDPAMVGLRQEDFRRMGAAGQAGNPYIGQYAPGIQMDYSLVKLGEGKGQQWPLYKIEEMIRADGKPDPEGRIEMVRQAMDYSANHVTRDMLGTSYDDLVVEQAARALLSPGVADADGQVRSTTTTVEGKKLVAGNVAAFYTQVAKYPASAQSFVQATLGNEIKGTPAFANLNRLLVVANSLPSDQQLSVAHAILKDPKVAAELTTLVAHSQLGSTTIEQFTTNIKNLNANSAPMVLNTIALITANEPAKLAGAFSAIAKDPKAAAAIASAVALDATIAKGATAKGNEGKLGSDLSASLSTEQFGDIAHKSHLDAKQVGRDKLLPMTVQDKVTTNTRTNALTVPGVDLTEVTAAGREKESQAFMTKTAKAWLHNPSLNGRALTRIASENPELFNSAAIYTLAERPDLMDSAMHIFDKLADRNQGPLVTDKYGNQVHATKEAQRELTDILQDLVKAQHGHNDNGIKRATDRLSAFLSAADAPGHADALAMLNTAVVQATPELGKDGKVPSHAVTGRQGITNALLYAIDHGLPNSPLTPQQTASAMYVALFGQAKPNEKTGLVDEPTHASDFANAALAVHDTLAIIGTTLRPTKVFPFIPVFIPGGKHPGDNPPTNNPGPGCPTCHAPPPTPIPDPVVQPPVTTPPAPATIPTPAK